MAPDAWLTVLFSVLAVAGYLLWILDAGSGIRHVLTVLAVLSLVLALVFSIVAPPRADEAGGEIANSPAGAP
jgi:hypothetical protein